jgi:UDP-3-O-[3-hydroxymyristoyl] glucosamine N-acyltransferase
MCRHPRQQKEVAVGRVNEEVETENGTVLKYQHHMNGRGFVSPRARVQLSTFVAASAYVEADARVGDNCSIGSGSWIDQGVVLGERVAIGQNVHIGRETVVGNDARIGSHSRIGAHSSIGGGVRIQSDAQIPDGTVLASPAMLRLAPVQEATRRHVRESSRESTYLTSDAA